MISFMWSLATAIGFLVSGVLLREGEFRLAAILFVAAWLWMVFPKVPMWTLKKIGGLWRGDRRPVAQS